MGLLVGGLEPWNFEWLSRNSWEFHHPNWRTPSFFRGIEITNQIRIHTNCAWDNAGTCLYPSCPWWSQVCQTATATLPRWSVKLSGSKNIQVEYVEYHLNPPFWQPPSQYHKWFSHVFAITPAVLWIPLDLPGTWWCGWKTTDRELQVLHVRIYVPSGISAYYTMIIIIYIYNYIYTYIHTFFLIDTTRICVLYTFKMIITDERRRMNCSNFRRRLELLESWLD